MRQAFLFPHYFCPRIEALIIFGRDFHSIRLTRGGKVFYENLAWFMALWICVLVVRHLWRAAHPPALATVSSPKRKALRPKPRTPNDCPVCGRPHPTPIVGNLRKAGVLPWSERKNPRGKPKTICTASYACPCPD